MEGQLSDESILNLKPLKPWVGLSKQARKNPGRHFWPEVRVGLKYSADVGEIFLPFAGTARFVHRRPDFRMQKVGNRHAHA